MEVISSNENGLYIKKSGENFRCMYFAISLGQYGSLLKVLKTNGKMSERVARYFFIQIVKGLQNLH